MNEELIENVAGVLESVWTNEGRYDLRDDCLDYVLDVVQSIESPITDEIIHKVIIEFLCTNINQAISKSDMQEMNREYNESS